VGVATVSTPCPSKNVVQEVALSGDQCHSAKETGIVVERCNSGQETTAESVERPKVPRDPEIKLKEEQSISNGRS
jgi:hypothetical protein